MVSSRTLATRGIMKSCILRWYCILHKLINYCRPVHWLHSSASTTKHFQTVYVSPQRTTDLLTRQSKIIKTITYCKWHWRDMLWPPFKSKLSDQTSNFRKCCRRHRIHNSVRSFTKPLNTRISASGRRSEHQKWLENIWHIVHYVIRAMLSFWCKHSRVLKRWHHQTKMLPVFIIDDTGRSMN